MVIESKVSFDQVREVFLQQNPDLAVGTTAYALGLLEAANSQFGAWSKAILSLEDMLGIMLPPHRHDGFELIPPSGLTVSDALRKAELLPRSHICSLRIEELSTGPLSAIFLSAAPVADPAYPDYRDLVNRGYKGLTHLDGLHRLIAWARSGQSGIVAYVTFENVE